MAFLHKLQAYIFFWERLNFVQIISLIFNSLQMHQIVDQNKQKRFFRGGAVFGAQLVEQSLPTPEVRVSNPVIGKYLFTFNCKEKTKIKKKGGR